jgi:hypothetical protein
MDSLAPGSYLAISHLVSGDPETREKITSFFLEASGGNWGRVRREDEVQAFFEGLEIIEPGLVSVNDWHPDGREEEQTSGWAEYGGLARKP